MNAGDWTRFQHAEQTRLESLDDLQEEPPALRSERRETVFIGPRERRKTMRALQSIGAYANCGRWH